MMMSYAKARLIKRIVAAAGCVALASPLWEAGAD